MGAGLLCIGAVLLAMGWFAIGWVARGQENRCYAESRLRFFASQALAGGRAVLARELGVPERTAKELVRRLEGKPLLVLSGGGQ